MLSNNFDSKLKAKSEIEVISTVSNQNATIYELNDF